MSKLTPEERAKISRENGAKSHGPKTEEGRAKVAANAVKTGEHAQKLAHFLPPHEAVLCLEDRPKFVEFLKQLLEMYQPINQLGRSIVREIAIAQWQIDRYHGCNTNAWNLSIIDNAQKPSPLPPEFAELHAMALAVNELIGSLGAVHKINREIAQLQLSIARLERRLKFVTKNFPTETRAVFQSHPHDEPEDAAASEAEKQTQPEDPELTDNKPFPEPPLYVTENDPEVIANYKRFYPNRKIVLMPADDVAKGINLEDDLPPAPRKTN